MSNFISIHIVNDIPWSNLNRDDSGTPKRTMLGGVERGLLSSQSIKRAIRKDFENRILEENPLNSVDIPDTLFGADGTVSVDASVRSRNLAKWVVSRAKVLSGAGDSFNEKSALKTVNKMIKNLVGGEKDTVIWLSVEELETLAKVVSDDINDIEGLDSSIAKGKIGSLAIASFGRMFASSTDSNVDAAIAVSPAISTHQNLIETDYFIASDDFGWFKREGENFEVNNSGAGAAHIGTALYTSGVFYRTVTIDVRELENNWTGATSEKAQGQIKTLIRSIVSSLPTGKKNSTAPYVAIPLIIVDQQQYREALSIEAPVESSNGFLIPTVEKILSEHAKAKKFNGINYGETLFSGTLAEDNPVTVEELCDTVSGWIMDSFKKPEIEEKTLFDEEEDTTLEDESALSDGVTLESDSDHSENGN